MLEEFSNIKAIASYLGLRRSTLYTLVEKREIPHYRIGRQIRFRLSEIEEWLKEQKEPVIDVSAQEKKIIGSIEEKAGLDVDGIIKKAIEGVTKKRYIRSHGKPDHKGRRKEA